MSSTFLGIEIAKRSLAAHQRALDVTGHNIANANTEGYSRQRVKLEATDPDYPASMTSPQMAGQIGTGVTIAEIERVRDIFLDNRIESEMQTSGYWEALYDKLHRIELIYNEPSDSSIRNLLNEFWQSLQELANNPEELKIREIVRQRGISLAEGIQHTYKQLLGLRNNINDEVVDLVNQMNDYGGQIAQLNGQIKKVENEGRNPNDLLDKRELLLEKLSRLASIKIERSDPDDFKVSVGGKVFVQRDHFHPLATMKDMKNDKMAKIYWPEIGDEVFFTNGEVKALLDARDTFVNDYHIARLDEYTIFLIDSFNELHRAGFGLRGSTKIDFFEPFQTLDEDRIFKVTGSKAGYVHDTNMALHDPFDSTCITLAANPSMVGLDPEGAFEINGHIFHYVASEDSLQDVVDRINAADIGVIAHINPARRLVLRATAEATYKNTSIETPYTITSLRDDPERGEYQSTTSRNEVALDKIDKSKDFSRGGFDPKLNLSSRIRIQGGSPNNNWTSNPLGSYQSIESFIEAVRSNTGVRISYDDITDRFTITNNNTGDVTVTDINNTSLDPVTDGFLSTGIKVTISTSITLPGSGSSTSFQQVVTDYVDMTRRMSALDTTCAFATAGFNTVPSASLDLNQAFANAGFLNAPAVGSVITITDDDGNSWSSGTVSTYSSVQAFIDAVNKGCRDNRIDFTLSYNPVADRFIFEAGAADTITVADAAGNFLSRSNHFGDTSITLNAGTLRLSQRGVGPGVTITGAVAWSHALSDFSSMDEFISSIDKIVDIDMNYNLYTDRVRITNNTVGPITINEVIPTGGTGFWTAVGITTGNIPNGGSAETTGEVVDNANPADTPTSFERAGFIAQAGSSIITISSGGITQKFYIDSERTSVRGFMSAVNTSSCGVDVTYDPITDRFTFQAKMRGTDFTLSETLGIKSGYEVSNTGTGAININGNWTTGSNWNRNIPDQTIKINGVEFRIDSSGAPGTYPNLSTLMAAVNSSLAGVTMNYDSSEPDRLTITSTDGKRILIEGGLGPGIDGDFWDEVKIKRGIHGGLLTTAVIPSGEVAGNLLEKLGILVPGQSYEWRLQETKSDLPITSLAGEYIRTPEKRAAYLIGLTEAIMNDLSKIAAAKGIDTSVPLDGVWDKSNGVGDGSNTLELSNLKYGKIFNKATTTFDGFFGTTVAKAGSETSVAKGRGEDQELFIDNLKNLRQSISGVSLDEEMINMIKLQHGYQAAARIAAALNQMIQTVIGLVG